MNVQIPLAIQLVVDDVGWREGWSLAAQDGPYRSGVDRLLEPDDYAAIAAIGAKLQMRPQAAMVLCEWDRENVCAHCPTSTVEGSKWDNSARCGQWTQQAAQLLHTHAANLELTLHGVGHEHWEQGVKTRAEWYCANGHRQWPWDVLCSHLTTFRQILDQHDLGPAAGHSLPVSAVPCAFQYYFNAADPTSTGALFAQAGVRFVSTPFNAAFDCLSPLATRDGGFEHGLTVINRDNNQVPWHAYDTLPAQLTENPICGIHWPNLLMPQPQHNHRSVDRWVQYLQSHAERPDLMLAANTPECFSQWLFHRFVRCHWDRGDLVLDGRYLPPGSLELLQPGPLWLKIALPHDQQIAAIHAPDLELVAYQRSGAYALLALRGMRRQQTRLTLTLGPAPAQLAVVQRGTCLISRLADTADQITLEAKVFGQQQLVVRVPRPVQAVHCIAGSGINIQAWEYAAATAELSIQVAAHDIQGEACALCIST